MEPQSGGGFISKLYFNGQLQYTKVVSYTNLETTTFPLRIGTWGGNFQGQLDDLAIYHRTLTQADIQDLMTNGPSDLAEADLKAYYPFDVDTVDFQTNTVQDLSIHGNHGQISGGVTQIVRSTHYLTRDGLNSVSEATDSGGGIVERYSYDVYGKPAFADGTGELIYESAIGNRYLYTGREWEPKTWLYYYRARHYEPRIGRFLQPDPIGFAGGDINLYTYVRNNPIIYADPSGLILWGQTFKGAARMVVGGIATASGIAFAGATFPTIAGPAAGTATAVAGSFAMGTGVC